MVEAQFKTLVHIQNCTYGFTVDFYVLKTFWCSLKWCAKIPRGHYKLPLNVVLSLLQCLQRCCMRAATLTWGTKTL